jgi:hypothetical protein
MTDIEWVIHWLRFVNRETQANKPGNQGQESLTQIH